MGPIRHTVPPRFPPWRSASLALDRPWLLLLRSAHTGGVPAVLVCSETSLPGAVAASPPAPPAAEYPACSVPRKPASPNRPLLSINTVLPTTGVLAIPAINV